MNIIKHGRYSILIENIFCTLQAGQRILQGILQMLFHQITGFGNFSILICFKDLLMHLPDIMLRFRLRFI